MLILSTLFTRPGEILESLARGMFTTNEHAIATVGLHLSFPAHNHVRKNILSDGNRTEWGQIRFVIVGDSDSQRVARGVTAGFLKLGLLYGLVIKQTDVEYTSLFP